jgi:hypothetical protein
MNEGMHAASCYGHSLIGSNIRCRHHLQTRPIAPTIEAHLFATPNG